MTRPDLMEEAVARAIKSETIARRGTVPDIDAHFAALARAAIEAMQPALAAAEQRGREEERERCASLCDAEADLRHEQGRKAAAGDVSWGIDTHASMMDHYNKAITARALAAAIRRGEP